MRYARSIRKVSMFILFSILFHCFFCFSIFFVENDENVLSELCSTFYPNSHMWTYGSIAASAHIRPHCKETTAKGRPARHGRQSCYRLASLFLAESRQDSCSNPQGLHIPMDDGSPPTCCLWMAGPFCLTRCPLALFIPVAVSSDKRSR